MTEVGGFQQLGNMARDAGYYVRALTNVLPNQTWKKPGPALKESLLSAHANSVRRGDGKHIRYPDWDENPVGKRIIGQANTHVKDGNLVVKDTYDFYDGEVSDKYKKAMDENVQRAWEEKNYPYLAQTYATELYKKKQGLMPWANPKIEYEIPLPEGHPVAPASGQATSKPMETLNRHLFRDSPVADVPTETPVHVPVTPQPSSYEVQPGENLTNIARQSGMTLEQLLAMNKDIRNPDLVPVGYKLNISK